VATFGREERDATVRGLRTAGWSMRRIATHVGLSVGIVHEIVRRANELADQIPADPRYPTEGECPNEELRAELLSLPIDKVALRWWRREDNRVTPWFRAWRARTKRELGWPPQRIGV
jgi:transposase